MEILFATGNKRKITEIAQFLEGSGITLIQKDIELVEPRSDSIEKIACEKARHAQKTVNEPLIVDDSGLFIESLNNFPGTNSKWVFDKIGCQGILDLIKGKNRSAEFMSAIAFAAPKKEPIVFVGRKKGTISENIRGASGFGYDPIFIPENSSKTWAEAPEEKNTSSHRKEAIELLVKWLKDKENNQIY